jgi:transcription initiation factor TFIID TATA-box-binding protein
MVGTVNPKCLNQHVWTMLETFLVLPWDQLWTEERRLLTKECIAVEYMGLEKWDPPCDMTEPFIHNVVSTSKVHSIQMPINLEKLALLLKNSTYDKKRFAAITIRTCNPFCTALLFTSGKLVVTGVQSFYECVLASLSIMKIINMVYPMQCFQVNDCVVQNMVAHSTFNLLPNQRFDIQAMYEHLPVDCTYQRNMFPGLIYRSSTCPVVVLCFFSGKVVLTGGKSIADIHNGWKIIWDISRRFIRT